MAYSFADGFDLYAAYADMANSYWDSIGSGGSLQAGRFAGSQGLALAATAIPVKSSGVNDAVHHIVVSFKQTTAISGTSNGQYIELFDGATAQCTISFQGGGAIVLTSGGPAGTVLATYSGAFPVVSTWYSFEFEVVINNTTGSFAVRKNGNSVNDFTATGLNTRPTSTNNYANKIQLGLTAGITQIFDDLFWQSGASTGTWLGELRCVAMMPVSDQGVTFSRFPATLSQVTIGAILGTGISAGVARYSTFTSAYDGALGSVILNLSSSGFTGNVKVQLFASAGGAPTTTLGSTGTITNPAVASPVVTFTTPATLVKGTQYHLGFVSDTGGGTWNRGSGGGFQSTTSYASFPVASPTVTATDAITLTLVVTLSANNNVVSEAQQDGLTTYVYDSNPGDADFYGVNPLVPAGASVKATTTRAYMQKDNIGTRTAAVQLKSSSAPAPSTWDPATLSAVTLAGGNLSATNTGTTSTNQGAHVPFASALTSGKYYFEVTLTNYAGGAGVGIAIGDVASTYAGLASTASNGVECYTVGHTGSGTIFVRSGGQHWL